MRIGSLAESAGISRRLLRYYEEQGLLHPTRTANGYRNYEHSDIDRVGRIRVLLNAGIPTAIIARLLDCTHREGDRVVPVGCPGVMAQLTAERSRIAEQIARLQSSQQVLDDLLLATGH